MYPEGNNHLAEHSMHMISSLLVVWDHGDAEHAADGWIR
jgi:hypothetical protein